MCRDAQVACSIVCCDSGEEVLKRSSKDYQADETFGTKQSNSGKAGKNSAGLSAGNMEAMISADTSMKQADVHGSVARTMEGRAHVLEAEIKQDSAMGAAPTGKEEALAEARAMADEATSAQMGSLARAEQKASKAAESEREQNASGIEEKDDEADSTFDTEQLGVPFSRGYNPVDVKL